MPNKLEINPFITKLSTEIAERNIVAKDPKNIQTTNAFTLILGKIFEPTIADIARLMK